MSYLRSVPRVWRERRVKYQLIGGRCKDCGRGFYPYRQICPACGSANVEQVKLPERGVVELFTVVRTPPAEFAQYAPYVVAIVRLEDGTLVPAQLTDVELDEVYEGMEVEAVFRKYREQGPSGIIEYGIKFRPAR
ncbi:MAG: Zn-ribbon domain-containing OB-fold protein [Thermofilum sp.]|nr:Zn-ribbon domain-containing OB-fold protein [Thermofilum sp.]